MSPGRFDRRDAGLLALLTAAWVTAILLVHPVGSFPVIDDWAYGPSAHLLATKGELVYSDWTAANHITHFLWGALFVSLFGYSQETLRASTLVVAWLGAIAAYNLLRLVGSGRGPAAIGAAALLFNPLSFALSFSYMTDVHFASAQTISLWLISSGMVFRSKLRIALGFVMAGVALLCRQIGFAIALAFAGERIVGFRSWWRTILSVVIPIAFLALVASAYRHWLFASGNAPAMFERNIADTRQHLIDHPLETLTSIPHYAYQAGLYIGLFCFPILLCTHRAWRTVVPKPWQRYVLLGMILVGGARFIQLMDWGVYWPTLIDTISTRGVLSQDIWSATYAPDLRSPPRYYFPILSIVTAIAVAGAVMLVVAGFIWVRDSVVRWWRGERDFRPDIFVAFAGAIQLALIPLLIPTFDRYLIPVIPTVIVTLGAVVGRYPSDRWMTWLATCAVSAMALVSVVATHDVFAGKRVRWSAYQELTRYVPTKDVDAGWVINGSSNFGKVGSKLDLHHWYDDRKYLVLLGPGADPGYKIVAICPVERWVRWFQADYPVVIQQRKDLNLPRISCGAEK